MYQYLPAPFVYKWRVYSRVCKLGSLPQGVQIEPISVAPSRKVVRSLANSSRKEKVYLQRKRDD